MLRDCDTVNCHNRLFWPARRARSRAVTQPHRPRGRHCRIGVGRYPEGPVPSFRRRPRSPADMPMREECKNFESRTYRDGETVRKCNLDLAPEAPWRCPDDCPKYERRLADAAWTYGSLVTPPTPDEPRGEGIAELLDEAEDIINSVGPE